MTQECTLLELSGSWAGDSTMYLIWYEDSEGRDCIVNDHGVLRGFYTRQEAENACDLLGFVVTDAVFYDAARLECWITTHNMSQILLSGTQNIDCEFLIGFWNVFTDIGAAVGETFEPVLTKRMRRCYDKLFWWCHISVLVPEGVRYVPHFTRRELRAVRQLMQRGMEFFSRNLHLE